MTTRQKTVSLRKFLGLNKRDDPMELRSGGRGYEAAEAMNVDFTNNWKFRRRKGYLRQRTASTRKIWANKEVFLSVEGTNLVDVRDFNSTGNFNTSLDPNGTPGFAEVLDSGEVYYSDSVTNGKFVDGAHTQWEVEQPNGPGPMAAAAGSLRPGCYQVLLTYVHADGRESGCGKSEEIDLPNGGGITLSAMPTGIPGGYPAGTGTQKKRIYVSEPDGKILYRRAEIAINTVSRTISNRTTGERLKTQFKNVPPKSEIIAYAGSRMAVAVDEFLLLSEPFSYHLFDYGEGFLTFPQAITTVVPTIKGVYVSAGSMYFVDLSKDNPPLRRVSSHPALAGTAFQIDADRVSDSEDKGVLAGWVAEDGIMIGSEDGTVRNLTYDKIDIGQTDTASVLVREENGVAQVITSLKNPQGTNMHVSDVAIATVKKRSIVEDFNVVDPNGEPLWDSEGVPLIYEE
jgi:hypothetical protein